MKKKTCGIPSMADGPLAGATCDLEFGHAGVRHASEGDGFYVSFELDAVHRNHQYLAGRRVPKLSPAQLRSLEDVRDHGDPWARVFSQSAFGGMNGVMRVLTRNKWIVHARRRNGGYRLTEAGKAILEFVTKARRR